MATSGSTNFDLTRNEIIEMAFSLIGQLEDGEDLTSEQYSKGSKFLNAYVKNLAADDILLWKQDWITLSLTASDVVLGSDGYDYKCIRNHTSSADTVPITGSDYMSYWKKLTTSAGAAHALSTAYTSINNQFLDTNILGIERAIVREDTTTNKMTRMSEEDFMSLGDLTSEGKPTQFMFRRQDTPELYLYPYPDSASNYVVEAVVYRYAEDFDNGTDNPDFLQEWILPLAEGLGRILAPSAGIFGEQKIDLIRDENTAKNNARSMNFEKGNTRFIPRLK